MTPLVSVITPTWRRHETLLTRCIPSVRAQTYRAIEHVIVSDGPDPDLRGLLGAGVTYDELPDRPAGPVDYGSRARNRALELATGRYVAYLDDDNAYRPDHLAILVHALRDSGADFAFSQLLTTRGGVIGGPTPAYGHIDTSLIVHQAGLPQECGGWPMPQELDDQHAPDWGVVARWLAAGATWTWVPTVTVDYWSG
jgi:glycosyltransferase involved in cell wall biosynthesis